MRTIKYIIVLFIPGVFYEGGSNIATYFDREVLLVLLLAILGGGLIQQKFKNIERKLFDENSTHYGEWLVLLLILIFRIINLINNSYNPFIYFQF